MVGKFVVRCKNASKGETMAKRILSIFLLAALMSAVLCSCGGGSTDEQPGNDGSNVSTGESVHGGEITVESNDEYTAFTVSLPIEK